MPQLLDPISIRGFRLSNRLVMPPMATNKSSPHGEVTAELIKHYDERAVGLGLVIVEHSYISAGGRASKRQLGIYDNNLIPGLVTLVNAIHEKETAVAVQINHAGSATYAEVCNMQPLAPSPIRNPKNTSFDVPRAMNIREIEDTVDSFAKAAGRAIEAGFDAVEIHGAHGFLLNQFSSPLTNLRLDEYGGELENRARFAVEVVRKVREEIGVDSLLLYRLGCEDMLSGGLTLDEGRHIAKMVVDAGIDIVDVSGGLGGYEPPRPFDEGYFVPQAEAIRKFVNVPVIGVGGIKTPQFADRVISSGQVDMVAVGRAILYDAVWGLKAIQTLEKT